MVHRPQILDLVLARVTHPLVARLTSFARFDSRGDVRNRAPRCIDYPAINLVMDLADGIPLLIESSPLVVTVVAVDHVLIVLVPDDELERPMASVRAAVPRGAPTVVQSWLTTRCHLRLRNALEGWRQLDRLTAVSIPALDLECEAIVEDDPSVSHGVLETGHPIRLTVPWQHIRVDPPRIIGDHRLGRDVLQGLPHRNLGDRSNDIGPTIDALLDSLRLSEELSFVNNLGHFVVAGRSLSRARAPWLRGCGVVLHDEICGELRRRGLMQERDPVAVRTSDARGETRRDRGVACHVALNLDLRAVPARHPHRVADKHRVR